MIHGYYFAKNYCIYEDLMGFEYPLWLESKEKSPWCSMNTFWFCGYFCFFYQLWYLICWWFLHLCSCSYSGFGFDVPTCSVILCSGVIGLGFHYSVIIYCDWTNLHWGVMLYELGSKVQYSFIWFVPKKCIFNWNLFNCLVLCFTVIE